MRYSDILSLNDQFIDTFDLVNESESYWKTFVPTERFITILKAVIDSIDTQSPKDRKSFWVIGSYGSGKSHASSVVKHLLSDDQKSIDDFLSSRFANNLQLTSRLRDIRKRKRFFPVVIKGSSGISDSRDFAFTIQKAVAKALDKSGINMVRETEFSKAIKYINNNNLYIDWEKVIESNEELRSVVSNLSDLIRKLENYDSRVLKIWEKVSDFKLTFEDNIESWLGETQQILKSDHGYSGLFIMWDEFTSLLEMPESGSYLSILQNIAELSKDLDQEVYLYIISHRRPEQTPLSQSDIKHLQERIKDFDYSMEPITTYQIMYTAIQRNDPKKWEEKKNHHRDDITSLVDTILDGSSFEIKRSLSDLFPIHPYSAYLSTYFARTIGSRERSIFNFLHDEERGFVKYIKTNPQGELYDFLTVDLIFDYFLPELEKMDDINSLSILGNYNTYSDLISKKDNNYMKIYKGLLLLNLFVKTLKVADGISSSLLKPNEENVSLMFKGTELTQIVTDCLSFIDHEHIIVKNPNGLYEIGSSRIPYNEVQERYDELLKQTIDFTEIADDKDLSEISRILLQNVLRETADPFTPEVLIVPANIKKHELIPKIIKARKRTYKILHIIFIGLHQPELSDALKMIKTLDWQTELNKPPYVFIILDTIFSTEDLSKVLHYKSYELVAQSQNLSSDEISGYKKQQSLIIKNWINQLSYGYATVFTLLPSNNPLEQRIALNKYGEFINNNLSLQFFNMGPEVLSSKNNKIATSTIWKKQVSRKAAQAILLSDNKKDFENQLKSSYTYLSSFYHTQQGEDALNNDFSVSLAFKDHIIYKTRIAFDQIMNDNVGNVINIGKKFKFLSEAPYGYYPCTVFLGMLAWLFKPYLGKIYLKDSAKVVNAQDMLDLIVSFFDYASENEQVDSKKLTIRIGSPQEDKLINLLCDIFNPEQKGSLKLIVWDIALDYVKNKFRYPLWIAKYHNIAQSNEAVLSALDSIIELFKAVKDEEYSSEFVNTIYNKISSVQTDLRIIFNDTKNNPELFKKWLVSKKVNNISELNIGAIEEYIIKNSGEELVYTCEDETATYNRVLEFLLQKSNNGGINNPIDNDISTDNNGTEVIDTTNGNYTDTSETMRVVNILTNAGWDSKFIRIMEKILTSVPQAMNIVIKALQEEGINV
jgi:hypothetical protein